MNTYKATYQYRHYSMVTDIIFIKASSLGEAAMAAEVLINNPDDKGWRLISMEEVQE